MSEDLSNENVEPEVEVTAEEVNEEVVEDQAEGQETKEEEAPDYEALVAERSFELRRERREREQLEKRLAEIEAQKQQVTRPNVPAMPDPWDDDYEEKVRQRDTIYAQAVEYDTQQRLLQEQEHRAQQERQRQQEQELYKRAATYTDRAKALGIDAQELAQAGQRLTGQVTDDVVNFILDNDQGPLMTKYLAANPLELDKLQNLNPMQAAVYLETQVKPKAAQFGQKKVSQAPEPVETLNGGGAAPQRGPKGAKFE